jgi:hypothetical protein
MLQRSGTYSGVVEELTIYEAFRRAVMTAAVAIKLCGIVNGESLGDVKGHPAVTSMGVVFITNLYPVAGTQ